MTTPFSKSQFSKEDFSRLYSLEGKWSMNVKAGKLYEIWTKQNDALLLGESFIEKDGKQFPQEKIRLYLSGENIFYAPTVFSQNDGKEILFKLIELNENKFVFENKEHDFPQRIIYDLKSMDEVDAAIEGNFGGDFKRIEFPYKRKN